VKQKIKKPFVCEECGKQFTNLPGLQSHTRAHARKAQAQVYVEDVESDSSVKDYSSLFKKRDYKSPVDNDSDSSTTSSFFSSKKKK